MDTGMDRKISYSRLFCLILIVTMVFAGMRTESKGTDSFLSNTSTSRGSYVAVIQRIAGGELSSVLFERKLSERTAAPVIEREVCRVSNIRGTQWNFFQLLIPAVFLLPALAGIFLILSAACRNQSRWRILEFIHQKDGKKA